MLVNELLKNKSKDEQAMMKNKEYWVTAATLATELTLFRRKLEPTPMVLSTSRTDIKKHPEIRLDEYSHPDIIFKNQSVLLQEESHLIGTNPNPYDHYIFDTERDAQLKYEELLNKAYKDIDIRISKLTSLKGKIKTYI